MLLGGFELAERMLGFPVPVVVACTGHALAMGSFLLCSGDYRIGAEGEFKIQATRSQSASRCRYPRSPPAPPTHALRFDRAVGLAAMSARPTPSRGLARWVFAPDDVVTVAQEVAIVCRLDAAAHLGTKRRARADMLAAVHAGIEAEFARDPSPST